MVGAAVGTTYLFPLIRWHIRALVPNPLIADLLAFLILLFAFLLLSDSLSSRIKKSVLGGLDRSLGLGFGFVRGVF